MDDPAQIRDSRFERIIRGHVQTIPRRPSDRIRTLLLMGAVVIAVALAMIGISLVFEHLN
jgi:hypothetical protein